jgi:transcriptional regulator with XRE-family HTH domain
MLRATSEMVVTGTAGLSRLRCLREQRGISRDELAAASGVTAGTIYNLERGRVTPNRATLIVIAAALEVDEDAVWSRDEILQRSRPSGEAA